MFGFCKKFFDCSVRIDENRSQCLSIVSGVHLFLFKQVASFKNWSSIAFVHLAHVESVACLTLIVDVAGVSTFSVGKSKVAKIGMWSVYMTDVS